MHPAEDAYGRYRARIHLYRHARTLAPEQRTVVVLKAYAA